MVYEIDLLFHYDACILNAIVGFKFDECTWICIAVRGVTQESLVLKKKIVKH